MVWRRYRFDPGTRILSFRHLEKALEVIQVLSPGADLKFAPIFQRLGNWFRNPEMQIRVLLGALR